MLRYDGTSSVPIFANGAAYAAFTMAVQGVGTTRVEADQSGALEGDGKLASLDEAKKTLVEHGLVPDQVLNSSDVMINRTGEYGLEKDGKIRGALSLDEVAKLELKGWRQVDGAATQGGSINIFKQATLPGHQAHTGIVGRTLTGQQNLVQTIFHEYQHYIGVPSHGKIPGTFEWRRWGRKEGRALAPVFDK